MSGAQGAPASARLLTNSATARAGSGPLHSSPLRRPAASAAAQSELSGAMDSLGRRLQAQRPSHANDGALDGAVSDDAGHIAHEERIDLGSALAARASIPFRQDLAKRRIVEGVGRRAHDKSVKEFVQAQDANSRHGPVLSDSMIILDTERLLLREFTPLDAPFLLELLNEPGWLRNISTPGVHSRNDALAWAEGRLFKAYRELGHGFWAIERHEDGELVGMCGLFKRPTLPEPDLGYALLARHERRGYALEAARGCVVHARQVMGWKTLMAITALDNPPSVSLLGKLGFVEQGQKQLEGYNEPSRVFSLVL